MNVDKEIQIEKLEETNHYFILCPDEWNEYDLKNYISDKYGCYRQHVFSIEIHSKDEVKKSKIFKFRVMNGLKL